ncbi:TetR/AcrR family transcriptional regulator [Acetohalobium arabaticum]|uniref:Transcriptional regulator, TetR family n=1 Tax=Acetohalobium arabaticum (strain ATCC 49924 / DSM 5501 / Z-7288) TaxID=574087 RepID=D9QRQ5_ACEAZ|nr:TetR/AcrR family transcriptional regulator [Acetohalobium arabaticum]ADL13196.1 transcriptional regulator, TetR family [Acetohalobium arabaticum DSM 5501]
MNSKQEKIFTAAIEKFSQKGSTNTTMQEIAETAGVGKGTLYRYFKNKEDLIFSLIKYGIDEMASKVKEAVENVQDPVKKLEIVIEVQLEFYNQYRGFCKFLTREIWGPQSKFEEHIKEIRTNNTVIIEDIISQGIEEGKLKGINAELGAVSLSGMINITALHWFMFHESFPVEKIKENLISLYFDGIII